MRQYLDAAREVLERGTRKENRTGVDTLSTFNINYEIDLREGFPLLTTKRVSWKNIVVENLWFLSGFCNTAHLERHGCTIWREWTNEYGDAPRIYGPRWRNFGYGGLDQIEHVLGELKTNPNSRRMVVCSWVPGTDWKNELAPCHCFFVFNVQRDENGDPLLCLHLTQRSADMALGVPYNIAGYAFLLELFARFAGMRAGIFAHTLIDAHVYTSKPDGSMAEYDHVPGLREQLSREPRKLPRLVIADSIRDLPDAEALFSADTATIMSKFKLEGYDPHSPISFKVAV